MRLKRIEVRNLRNLSSVSLLPSPGLNILEGENASGKTSFLETIHILGLARSFRSGRPEKLIQYGQDSFTIFAEAANGSHHRIGVQRFLDQQLELRLDGNKLHTRSELASILPLQLITPDSTLLLTGGPNERRSFLDWVMFHVEHHFYSLWKLYQQNLKQRNALLRHNSTEMIGIWSQGITEYGEQIDRLRKRVIERLIPYIRHYCELLLPSLDIQVSYRQGWRKEYSFAESIERSLDSDLKMRFTTTGPHRADLVFKDGNRVVTEVLSRGQLKLLLCALKLAQMGFLNEEKGISPIVLIDDLPAELDHYHRNLLLSLLHQLDTQAFVTSTSRELLDLNDWDDVKMFHVKHGNIKEVV